MRPNLLSLIPISKMPRKKSKKSWRLILFAFLLGIIFTFLLSILLKFVNFQQVKDFVNKVIPFVQENGPIISFCISFIFGLVGVLGSLITGKRLKEIKQANQELREDTSNRLKELKQANLDLEDEIVRLEDSTRKNYYDFGSIFARSLWLLKRAKEEIYYVNFLHSLGVPHKTNQEVITSYKKHAKELNDNSSSNDEKIEEDYEQAVKDYYEILLQKMQQVDHFVSIVLTEENLKSYFLDTLKERPGYEKIDELITEVIKREKEFFTEKLEGCRQIRGQDKDELKVDRLPEILLQLLITKIDKRGISPTDSKWGCLVFFVGTHNIGRTRDMKGYYTEDKHQVEIYKELVEILRQKKRESSSS